MKTVLSFPIVLALLIFAVSKSWSCLHFAATYKNTITEGKKEALVYHDGKNAHLVIRTQLTSDKMPKEIAWVIPFPSLPVKYGEVDASLFEELYQLTAPELRTKQLKMTDSLRGVPSSAIVVHPKTVLEHYEIQPIEVTSDKSGNEFNQWLTGNGFNPMPLENQKYYLKKGAVFLAIRMKTAGLESVSVKPLHIVYPDDHVSFPIKFSHDSRTFDLDLYVFSENNLNEKNKDLSKSFPTVSAAYLKFITSEPYRKNASNPTLTKLLGDRSGFVSLFSARGLNSSKSKIKTVAADPSISLSDLVAKK